VDLNAITLSLDNTFVLQKRQMLGNGSLGKTEAFPDVLHITFLGTKAGNYFEPYRMPQYLQNLGFFIEISGLVKFTFFHN
jgi:hypothetical protein